MRYRLDPITPPGIQHPDWSFSVVSEAVFVSAPEPGLARAYAAQRLTPATPLGALTALRSRSPWQNDRLTTCVQEHNLEDLPEREVVLVRSGERVGSGF